MSCSDFCPEYGDGPRAYSVSAEPVAPHCWVLRTHEGAGGSWERLDPWVGSSNLRAERWVFDRDVAALASGGPRPYAHLFATQGDYPLSAHRAMEVLLRAMGFTWRYHEKRAAGGVRVVVTHLASRKKKVTFVPSGELHATFPAGYFDPPVPG